MHGPKISEDTSTLANWRLGLKLLSQTRKEMERDGIVLSIFSWNWSISPQWGGKLSVQNLNFLLCCIMLPLSQTAEQEWTSRIVQKYIELLVAEALLPQSTAYSPSPARLDHRLKTLVHSIMSIYCWMFASPKLDHPFSWCHWWSSFGQDRFRSPSLS